MIVEKEKAAASTAAKKLTHPHRGYLNCGVRSSLKLQLGEILLCLQKPLNPNQQRKLQQIFETQLRQFIDLRYSERQL